MSDDTSTSHKCEHKVLGWFGAKLADNIFTTVFTLVGAGSVLTAAGLVLRNGLLRLSQWPGVAFIVLTIFGAILGVLVFGLAVVYLFQFFIHTLVAAFFTLFKIEPPKRSRLLKPLDSLAVLILSGVDKLLDWRTEHQHSRVKQAASSQGSDNQP